MRSVSAFGNARPFDLWHLVPPSLQCVLPNVSWDRARLHALQLPIHQVALDDLRWQLDLPWWRDGERYFAVRPTDVHREPGRYPTHWLRTQNADLAYPIDLLESGRYVVLDGVHRLLKAALAGRTTISARIVSVRSFVEHVMDTDQGSAPR